MVNVVVIWLILARWKMRGVPNKLSWLSLTFWMDFWASDCIVMLFANCLCQIELEIKQLPDQGLQTMHL